MGIIAGATIGAGILLIFFFIALVFFLYRRRKGSEYGPFWGHSPPRVSDRQGLGGARRDWQLRSPGQVGPGCGPCPQVAKT